MFIKSCAHHISTSAGRSIPRAPRLADAKTSRPLLSRIKEVRNQGEAHQIVTF
jgi:hypothetical protein